nr:MAG TPA: hypothetical protein [Caudoviricetes sp.]
MNVHRFRDLFCTLPLLAHRFNGFPVFIIQSFIFPCHVLILLSFVNKKCGKSFYALPHSAFLCKKINAAEV